MARMEARKSYQLLSLSCRLKSKSVLRTRPANGESLRPSREAQEPAGAGGMSRPKAKELRTRSVSVHGQKKMDVPVQALSKSRFLCLFILLRSSEEQRTPTHPEEGRLLSSVYRFEC